MSQLSTTLRHISIIKKLQNGQKATFEEISRYLQQEAERTHEKLSLSKRTFQRDLISIRSIYEKDIQCNTLHQYYIAFEGLQPEAITRMLEAFMLFNSVKMAEGVSPFIHFEKRRPQGTEHIYELLHASQNHCLLHFDHQKFWSNEITHPIVEPYGLKEFKSRWYLLAKDRKNGKVKTFGLDRISNVEISKEKFKPDSIDVEEMFRDCFGILTDHEQKPQKIVLSFDWEHGKYVKSFPIHESQKILIDTEDELRIQLTLKITYDLLQEIQYHGDRVRVISPLSLRNQICEGLHNTLEKYA